jgi:hypothetical protein
MSACFRLFIEKSVQFLDCLRFPLISDVVIDLHDHLLIGMAHPSRDGFRVDPVRDAPFTEAMAEIIWKF